MRKEGNEGCVEADVRDASAFSHKVLPCCSAASDYHHFGRDAFRAVLRGTHDVVDTRGHTRSGHIAAVPYKHAAMTCACRHDLSAGGGDFHVGVFCQSGDGDVSAIFWAHRIGVDLHLVFAERFRRLRGIALEGAEAGVGAEEHFARGGINGHTVDNV